MKKRYKRGLIASVLTSASLLVSVQGFAALLDTHPDVTLRKWIDNSDPSLGSEALTANNQPYSPRATCGWCHDEAVDDTTNDAARIDGVAQGSYDGSDDANFAADYTQDGLAAPTKTVAKTQGIERADGSGIDWISFDTTAHKHGFVTGRHSQQGRNEPYGHHMRHAVKGKFWANSPGMFGKY